MIISSDFCFLYTFIFYEIILNLHFFSIAKIIHVYFILFEKSARTVYRCVNLSFRRHFPVTHFYWYYRVFILNCIFSSLLFCFHQSLSYYWNNTICNIPSDPLNVLDTHYLKTINIFDYICKSLLVNKQHFYNFVSSSLKFSFNENKFFHFSKTPYPKVEYLLKYLLLRTKLKFLIDRGGHGSFAAHNMACTYTAHDYKAYSASIRLMTFDRQPSHTYIILYIYILSYTRHVGGGYRFEYTCFCDDCTTTTTTVHGNIFGLIFAAVT